MDLVTRNKFAGLLAFFSGIIFLYTGRTSYENWKFVEEIILSTANVSFVKLVFSIILFMASLGGLLIIISSWFLYNQNIRLGKILLIIGVGSGALSLCIHIYLSLSSTTIDFSWLFSIGWIAVLLSIVAQFLAKRKRNRF
jgi:hypothetical protein